MPKRPLSPHAEKPLSKQGKYKIKFNNVWKLEFRWVQNSPKGSEFAHCSACKQDIKITHGGRNDLKRHSDTPSHKQKLGSISNTPTVSSLLGGSTTSLEYKVAFTETVFPNLIVEHNIPFLVADHFSDAVKVMFPDSAIAQKFHCKRTKTTHIVNEALAPHWDKKVEEMCRKRNFPSCWMNLMTVEMTRCWQSLFGSMMKTSIESAQDS